jgi:hypothetical protein
MHDDLVADGLILRLWREDDVDAVLAAFEPAEMLRQSGGRPINTPEAAARWLAGAT